MPPDRREPGTPEEWLNRAKSNLAIARNSRSSEVYLEDLCFEAQQAAEKALKAVLLANGIRFRFVHDLAELITLLLRNSVLVPDDVQSAASLTDYAVEARYPGTFEAVTEEELADALKTAETVVIWAERAIMAS
jgi:HEPN domain-containing protein